MVVLQCLARKEVLLRSCNSNAVHQWLPFIVPPIVLISLFKILQRRYLNFETLWGNYQFKDEFVLEVEQLLKDAYKFYKYSTKRKKGLQNTTLRCHREPIDEFITTLVRASDEGKKELNDHPALKLQCWNATCWLGWSACLISLCRSYEFILEHLTEFQTSSSESKKDKEVAEDLYKRLTSYDAFLFIYLYRDLAGIIATSTRLLQVRDLRICDVGRLILNLCKSLQVNYPKLSDVPTELLGDGMADNIMEELFAGKCTILTLFKLIYSYRRPWRRASPVTYYDRAIKASFYSDTTAFYWSYDSGGEYKF